MQIDYQIVIFKKYRMESSNFKNKTIVADGGNSEGGAGAKYQGAKHPNEKLLLLTQQ